MIIKLSACPFCGSEKESVVEIDIGQWAVVCDSCGAIGPQVSNEFLAVTKWNGAKSVAEYSSINV